MQQLFHNKMSYTISAMLKLSAALLNQPVMSLRTGAPVATTEALLINPNNLKIEGFYCSDRFTGEKLVLLPQDIRDLLPQGIAVNDHDVLSDPEDLVRLQDMMNLNFQLLGKTVVTVSKERLGKVNDFAADSETLYIQKLYIGQSVFKSFSSGQLSIDRDQVVEITPSKIVINDILKGTPAGAAVPA